MAKFFLMLVEKTIISPIPPLKGNKCRERETPLFEYNEFYLKKKNITSQYV